jgi:hypothetical protein
MPVINSGFNARDPVLPFIGDLINQFDFSIKT